MSTYQPTLREAEEQVARIERAIALAAETWPADWEPAQEATCWQAPSTIKANGVWLRFKGRRYADVLRWPVSVVERRCTDCGGVLRVSRDGGGHGFFYDGRWLSGDPSIRDPRSRTAWEPRYACLRCFNRIRPKLRALEQINEARLAINRIKRELRHAA